MPPTPPSVQVAPRIWVERTFPNQTASTLEETHLEARVFQTEPAKVRAEVSRTINLGNYESLRIAVGVELPCYTEEVEEGLHSASAMVSQFINNEEEEIKASLAAARP
jgi:succinylglutamate desuccinylase